jgi:hypothetical protein
VGLGWLLDLKGGQHHQMLYRHLDKSARRTPITDTDDVIWQMVLGHQMLCKHLMVKRQHLKRATR